MIKIPLHIVVEYSNTSIDMRRWEGTIFVDKYGNFEGLIDGVLDTAFQQYIIGKFIENQGMIFLRLSDGNEFLNNRVVFTTPKISVQENKVQTSYEELETNQFSNYDACDPLLQTIISVSHTKNTDIQNRIIYDEIKKWKEEASIQNKNMIDAFHFDLKTIVEHFKDEIEAKKLWDEASTVEQNKILEKHPSDSSNL